MKASMQVAREIVQTMQERGMAPGDRYLSEADAIRAHGVGRGTYREALRFLEQQGVLVMRSGRSGGPEIATPDDRHLASTIALLLQFADAPLRAVLEARMAIEPGMAELAARHATDAEVAAMAAKLDAIELAIGNYRAFSVAYQDYWRSLADSSHNALLSFLSPALRSIVHSGGFVPNEPYRLEVLARLRRIHAAVARHDAAGARAAMLDLEIEFQRRLTENYPRQVARTVCWADVVGDRSA
jgi:GntR family transcriptional repressor for pyruvate dehydrogenase complex